MLVAAAALFIGQSGFVGRSGVEIWVGDARSGRTLWHGPAQPGETVELRYVHSVERTPVVEVFRAEADGLHLVMMRFSSQGAGLPTEGYTREGNEFVLRTDRRIGTLRLGISAIARHQLVAGGERIDLVALAGDGTTVLLGSRPGPWRIRRRGSP